MTRDNLAAAVALTECPLEYSDDNTGEFSRLAGDQSGRERTGLVHAPSSTDRDSINIKNTTADCNALPPLRRTEDVCEHQIRQGPLNFKRKARNKDSRRL